MCAVLDISEFMTRTHYVYLCIRDSGVRIILCVSVCLRDKDVCGPEHGRTSRVV